MKKDRDPWGFAKWTSLFSLKLGLLFRQTACFIFQPSQCLAAPAPGIGNNDPVSPSLRYLKDPKCLSWQVAPQYSRQSLTGTGPGSKWAFPLVVLFDRYLGWAD